jgi:hypothetical protein
MLNADQEAFWAALHLRLRVPKQSRVRLTASSLNVAAMKHTAQISFGGHSFSEKLHDSSRKLSGASNPACMADAVH